MYEQIKEENQSISSIKVNTLVVIHKTQRTGEDGKKLGYSWYCDDVIGLVVAKGDNYFKIKLPNGTITGHNNIEGDSKDYYYTYSRGTDFAFEDAIKNEINAKREEIRKIQTEKADLEEWLQEFRNSIGFINKLVAFAKEFNK